MELTSLASIIQPVQAVSQTVDSTKSSTEPTKSSVIAPSSSFDSILQGILKPDSAKNVSEEALFAGVLVERITAVKGEEAGKEFQALLEKTETSMKSANGYIPYEDAARTALREYQAAGKLTAEESTAIHSQAFAAAQLDSNVNSLYDDVGGGSDTTCSVSQVESAIAAAKTALTGFAAGTSTPVTRSLDVAFDASGKPIVNPYDTSVGSSMGAIYTGKVTFATAGQNNIGDDLAAGSVTDVKSKGTYVDGAKKGFLWKPVGENSKNLVVLAQSGLQYDVASVVLKDAEGNIIEEGKHYDYEGESHPDALRKYNFSKPGGSYEQNITVEATMTNGAKVTYHIADPSKRYD